MGIGQLWYVKVSVDGSCADVQLTKSFIAKSTGQYDLECFQSGVYKLMTFQISTDFFCTNKFSQQIGLKQFNQKYKKT